MKRNIMQEILSETIIYGGCTATRREVYDDCIERGLGVPTADRFAFIPPAVQDGQMVPQLTLKQVRQWELALTRSSGHNCSERN